MAEQAATQGAPEASGLNLDGTDSDSDPDADGNNAGGWDEEAARKALNKRNKEAASLRARLKELEPLAQRAKELEDASKSESQRLSEALDSEKAGRAAAESKLLRYEVGAAKGVPPNLLRYLGGSDKAEIEEAADALLAELGTTTNTASKVGRTPERVAGSGPSSPSPDDDLDPLAYVEKIRAGRI